MSSDINQAAPDEKVVELPGLVDVDLDQLAGVGQTQAATTAVFRTWNKQINSAFHHC